LSLPAKGNWYPVKNWLLWLPHQFCLRPCFTAIRQERAFCLHHRPGKPWRVGNLFVDVDCGGEGEKDSLSYHFTKNVSTNEKLAFVADNIYVGKTNRGEKKCDFV
jgi:hypothetical protein